MRRGGKEKGTGKDESKADAATTDSAVHQEAVALGYREFIDLSIYFCSLGHWDSLLIKIEELMKSFSLFDRDPCGPNHFLPIMYLGKDGPIIVC